MKIIISPAKKINNTQNKENIRFSHCSFLNEATELINKKGVINVGGKTQSVYKFAKKYNKNIKKISAKKILGPKYPLNPSMNITKYKKIIKK